MAWLHYWARLITTFMERKNNNKDNDKEGPWLTPEMAANIRYAVFVNAESLLDMHQQLPKVDRLFFKKSI